MKQQTNQKYYWLRKVKSMTCTESIIVFIAIACLVAQTEAQRTALCYNYQPNVTALSKFNWAVVDSDANFEPTINSTKPIWLVYVSVGEVTSDRPYFKEMPKKWFIGNNTEWGSYIINQTEYGWPYFLVNKISKPLWDRGFKGFFLDTLDSYQRVVTTNAQRTEQENGLAKVISALKAKFPTAILILNRGFEIISRVHNVTNMVAFESLYSGWNQAQQKYGPVSENDRNWLLAKVNDIKAKYQLPILALDYCNPNNITCAQKTVNLIKQKNIIPYVTDALLQNVGYGP